MSHTPNEPQPEHSNSHPPQNQPGNYPQQGQPYPQSQTGYYTQPPKKERNTIGLIALIVAVIGFIFACIPGALIVGWILLPIAFILGIVSLFQSNKKKGMGITAIILSIVGVVVGVVVFLAVVASAFSNSFNDSGDSSTSSASTSSSSTVAGVSTERKNALNQAKTYSETMHMSKKGIQDQLSSDADGFSVADAKWAADHVDADWNANALAKAKEYQSDQSMSKEAIRTQLTSEIEGFTAAQADYAIQHLS